jgi:anti-anti-sigma factor
MVTGRLTMTGRLDARTSYLLYDAVSALLRAGQASWTVDVAGLDVADHAGLRAIAGAYRRALRHDCRITLHGASPALQHALARLRLDRHVLPGAGELPPARPVRR